MPRKNDANEIKLTRLYDAPVAAVWDAWVDPNQAAQWWGPRGFTLTTHSKDFRVGGSWVYTMHGPDGTDYPNTCTYLEIVQHSKMVYDHGMTGHPPMFRVTVVFAEVGGKTQMDMTMGFPTVEAARNTRKFIKQAGGNATWDRLAEYLSDEAGAAPRFVINRSFDAPLETMYQMWADPAHFSKWLAPTGFRMEFLHADIRPDGGTFFFMTNDAGMKMYGKAKYLELVPPHRVVYTQQFADEHGNLARHPMSPLWPATMLTVVTLTAEGPDQTRVTVTWEPHGPTTPEELDVFIKARGGMTQGWTGSFDKLEAYLESAATVQ